MNPAVIERFIKLMVIAILVSGAFYLGYGYFTSGAPGDYYVRKGDIRLGDGLYDEALENFNRALEEMPNHRGALMGRALVYIQTKRYDKAIAELDYLIDYLNRTLEPDDPTGRGALAAAYANRGIVHDYLGQYEAALADYVASLNTDPETVSGPDIFHKILYGSDDLSTVRQRARYLYEQLQLPEEERLLRVPELDAKQRMYKP
ncbi:MAG: tetratricopeptide repeat protein [Alphaproteobacteria bacterium]|nr:MAG: tetratricopeptide repeat protein [Alphaproteobacteria bacterium]